MGQIEETGGGIGWLLVQRLVQSLVGCTLPDDVSFIARVRSVRTCKRTGTGYEGQKRKEKQDGALKRAHRKDRQVLLSNETETNERLAGKCLRRENDLILEKARGETSVYVERKEETMPAILREFRPPGGLLIPISIHLPSFISLH